MEVTDVRTIEQPADEAQYRIAKIAVQWRHRAVGDPALETVAHDQLVAGTQPRKERRKA